MKKIDLNFKIADLEGSLIGNANKILAGLLMSEFKGDAVKLFDWAMSLNSTGIIEVDDADFQSLLDLMNKTERLSIIVKGPIIKYLNTLKK